MIQPAHKTALQNRTFSCVFCWSTSTGKERDEETGYGYFGARYMDHELMTMWLSVDPMADKYPSISPYAYCAWNPVKLVDPDGNESIDNDDWYINDVTGEVGWHEGHARKIVDVDGNTYTNIGEAYSQPLGNGQYKNYYQNCLITQGEKQDVSQLAYNNKSVRTSLIRRDSPLPDSHKKELFNHHIATRGVSSPDMIGIQANGSVVALGGLAVDVTFGYIKGSGICLSISPGVGCGFDISAGIGICIGNSSSKAPTRTSFGGLNYTVSAGYGSVYYQQSISATKDNHWSISTYGISVGSKTVIGGSAGVSYSF